MMCQISRKQLQSLRPKAENGEPIVFYKKMQARVLDCKICKICKNILIHFEAFSLQRCSSDFSRHGTNMRTNQTDPNGYFSRLITIDTWQSFSRTMARKKFSASDFIRRRMRLLICSRSFSRIHWVCTLEDLDLFGSCPASLNSLVCRLLPVQSKSMRMQPRRLLDSQWSSHI